MTLNCSVTFEFKRLPPTTHKTTVVGATVGTCVRRALQNAQKALRPVNWTSLVVVVLERVDRAAEDSEDAKDLTDEPAEA